MANTIKIRRSAVANQVPTTGQLALGELALNTYDGKLYTKKDDGSASIVQLSGGSTSTLQQVLTAGNSSTVDAEINGVTVGLGSSGVATNTAAGYQALDSNTTGTYNLALGYQALNDNTTGLGNTVAGYQALESNVDGDYNLALGYKALQSNTDGYENVALGDMAMKQGQSAYRNVAIGRVAVYKVTTGHENIGIGGGSLYYCEDGYRNVGVGRDSLHALVDQSHNVAIGHEAGYFLNGSNNTILGAWRGTSAGSTLSDTVIISAGTAERARCDSSGNWETTGTVTANAFDAGGTSSQYLMADGSTSTGGGVTTGKAIAMSMIFG